MKRRGFSFTEILFAVMIIAVGFIMLAAMFPVAINQTENSVSETTSASIGRQGSVFAGQVAQMSFVSAAQIPTPGVADQSLCVLTPTLRYTVNARNAYKLWQECNNPDNLFLSNFPPLAPPSILPPGPLPANHAPPPDVVSNSQIIPGEVWPLDFTQVPPPIIEDQIRAVNGVPSPVKNLFSGVVFNSIAGNMIQTGNPRFAWVAFYKRDLKETAAFTLSTGTASYAVSYAPQAQVIIVVLQARNTDSFATSDLTPGIGSLEPSRFDGSQLISQSSGGNTDSPNGGIQLPGTQGDANDRSASGAFVIIAADSLSSQNPFHGQLNGHVYRLGNRFTGAGNSWEFTPAAGITASDSTSLQQMNAAGATFSIYMFGMGRDPQSSATPKAFSGPAMDVAVYSSFVICNN